MFLENNQFAFFSRIPMWKTINSLDLVRTLWWVYKILKMKHCAQGQPPGMVERHLLPHRKGTFKLNACVTSAVFWSFILLGANSTVRISLTQLLATSQKQLTNTLKRVTAPPPPNLPKQIISVHLPPTQTKKNKTSRLWMPQRSTLHSANFYHCTKQHII